MKEIKKPFSIKRVLIITLGTFIMTTGLHYFLVPNNLMVGGASGVAMIFSNLVPGIPMSLALLIINVFLFVLGFLIIGRDFGGLTIYSSVLASAFLSILEKFSPMDQAFADDLLINMIFGAVLVGTGIGIVLNQGASTGGSDILGKILCKFSNLSMGSSLIIIDGLICLGSAFVFGPAFGMYAILGVFINSRTLDKILTGLNTMYDIIILSKEYEQINDYILDELHRASTFYDVKGGYSGSGKVLIQTVLQRGQYINLREYVRNLDPKAFMYVSSVSEVTGEGFTYELYEDERIEKRRERVQKAKEEEVSHD
ncbi:MAG: YitT family protein [Tissierellia bacterium]|nr:YitT family protein [Tissierellia bacterium]